MRLVLLFVYFARVNCGPFSLPLGAGGGCDVIVAFPGPGLFQHKPSSNLVCILS